MASAARSSIGSETSLGSSRPALDVMVRDRADRLNPLIDALLDDFHPFAIEDRAPGVRRVHFSTPRERSDAAEALVRGFGARGVVTHPVEVPNDGWAERAQVSLQAVRVGNIVVAPPWDVPSTPPSGAVVIIRPSMGFGTGHHASTRLCLRALQATPVGGRRVLDLGTGSGVLAIAAAKLGASAVVGIDRDGDALATARDNLALNSVTAAVGLEHGDVRHLDASRAADVVLANLTGTLLRAVAHRCTDCVVPGGVFIAGGLETSEEPAVRAAFEASGMTSGARWIEADWLGLTYTRQTASATRDRQNPGARNPETWALEPSPPLLCARCVGERYSCGASV